MQMVGVEQDMPGANRTPRERFAERLRCRNMIRVRIYGLMRCDDDLRAEFVDQCLQVGQQVVPGRGAVDIAWQRLVVPAARSADISVAAIAGSLRGVGGVAHGSKLHAVIAQLNAIFGWYASPPWHANAVPATQSSF